MKNNMGRTTPTVATVLPITAVVLLVAASSGGLGDIGIEILAAFLSLAVIAISGAVAWIIRQISKIKKLIKWLVGIRIDGQQVSSGVIGEIQERLGKKADEEEVEKLREKVERLEDEL